MLLIYIQQEKNCFGFVEFESADSVEKAVEVLLFILLFFGWKLLLFCSLVVCLKVEYCMVVYSELFPS